MEEALVVAADAPVRQAAIAVRVPEPVARPRRTRGLDRTREYSVAAVTRVSRVPCPLLVCVGGCPDPKHLQALPVGVCWRVP